VSRTVLLVSRFQGDHGFGGYLWYERSLLGSASTYCSGAVVPNANHWSASFGRSLRRSTSRHRSTCLSQDPEERDASPFLVLNDHVRFDDLEARSVDELPVGVGVKATEKHGGPPSQSLSTVPGSSPLPMVTST
jgi:hypothetical protein